MRELLLCVSRQGVEIMSISTGNDTPPRTAPCSALVWKQGRELEQMVSALRQQALFRSRRKADWIIVDGGRWLSVIAAITGADLAVLVSEPTVSGVHDLKAGDGYLRSFGSVLVCVNSAT